MAGQVYMFQIIEPGALECPIRHLEARRANNIDTDPKAGRHTQKRPCILRNVWLIKRESHEVIVGYYGV
ncbi:hypothetical protein MnTg02_00355 [bacterium MnTg02]|nr:hypothetical protein MnTg02_00355 [bacterium MnTg02]